MTGRLDKVDTSVNTVINKLEPVDPILLLEVSVESSIDIVHNWFPAAYQLLSTIRKASQPFIVVYEITESGGIDHSQFQPDTSFLNISSLAQFQTRRV